MEGKQTRAYLAQDEHVAGAHGSARQTKTCAHIQNSGNSTANTQDARDDFWSLRQTRGERSADQLLDVAGVQRVAVPVHFESEEGKI